MEYIKDGFIENKDIKNIDEVYNGYTYFKEGDILLAKVTPCFENGNLGIAKDLKNGIGFGTTEVHVIRAKKDNKKFIYYLFQNKHFKEKGNSEMYGAGGLKRIPSDFVENYIYPRPDYQTQICISNYLDQKTAKIDEIINKKEKLIDNLEKYKKSVITEAVTKGKLGDKYLSEDGELVDEIEMKDSGVEWIGEIPEYSDVIPFKRISIITSAKRIHEKDYRDKGIPFYRSKEVARLSKRLKAEARNYISKELFNKIKNRYGIPEKGDILITSIGTIGQVWVCDGRDFYYKDGNITQIILESNNYINSKFIKYCFDSNLIKKQYKKMSAGSTLQALTIEKIKELIIIQSNKKIKTNIVNYLDNKIQEINNLINKTKESIEKYKEYKKSLIFEAVTGKIDLRDYELEGGEKLAEHNNSSETERKRLSAVD
jgi:type I restriction enzyme S subunit